MSGRHAASESDNSFYAQDGNKMKWPLTLERGWAETRKEK
jgi:hypothetical protein